MRSDVLTALKQRDDELPEITDAGVGLTLLMVATLMADRERQALAGRIADAADARDWTALAALNRRLSAVPGAVSRMADVARAGIERYDAGMAADDDDPANHARARRALARTANWLDRRFWPMYGTVRPVMPPAAEVEARTPSNSAKVNGDAPPTCRAMMSERFVRIDQQLALLGEDDRCSALTAKRIMTRDRNAQAAVCRECGACALSQSAITAPRPLL